MMHLRGRKSEIETSIIQCNYEKGELQWNIGYKSPITELKCIMGGLNLTAVFSPLFLKTLFKQRGIITIVIQKQ